MINRKRDIFVKDRGQNAIIVRGSRKNLRFSSNDRIERKKVKFAKGWRFRFQKLVAKSKKLAITWRQAIVNLQLY